MFRAQQGAPDPSLVFLPILLATTASTLAGLLSVALVQRIKLYDPVVMLWLGGLVLGLGLFMASLATLSSAAIASMSSLLGNLTLFGIIMVFLLAGAWKKIPIYDSFIEGAREGFDISKSLLPYLVAMLCAIGVLRASGALDVALDGIRWLVNAIEIGRAHV